VAVSLIFSGLITSTTSEAETTAIEDSVVKIFSTVVYPDPFRPWSKSDAREISGSGVIIAGRRILSNAHVVQYARQVQVQFNQDGAKYFATVEGISPDMDLAVLKLDDMKPLESRQPLQLMHSLPHIKDAVVAYGYPTGGSSLSITKGVVSRIEFVPYSDCAAGLRIQIDAAVNPGNSGGPAMVGDKMTGLVFSHLNNAQNIGYIIPAEEIELFLNDIADGHYDGKPFWNGDMASTLENPAMRDFLKLDKSVDGLVVFDVDRRSRANPLRKWDVITRAGDFSVDGQGMVKLGENLRVSVEYLFAKLVTNGTIPLTIWRDGKELNVRFPVFGRYPALFQHLNGAYPSYFIYGPISFSTVTKELVAGMTQANMLLSLLYWNSPLVNRYTDLPRFDGESLVAITCPFFPHKIMKGYPDLTGQVVKSVNGTAISNLVHLVKVLRNSKEDFIDIEIETKDQTHLIFRRTEIEAATEEILANNGIRSRGSPEILAIWNAKAPLSPGHVGH
jgi:S1-C subfamily serine protease